jgi:hypothetical protein
MDDYIADALVDYIQLDAALLSICSKPKPERVNEPFVASRSKNVRKIEFHLIETTLFQKIEFHLIDPSVFHKVEFHLIDTLVFTRSKTVATHCSSGDRKSVRDFKNL